MNPFASRKGNQEIQASKLSQMRRNKINQQKQSKMQKMNIGLKLDDDDKAEKGGEAEEAYKSLPVKPSMSTIQDTLDDNTATPGDSNPSKSLQTLNQPERASQMKQNFMLDLEDSSQDHN